MTVQLDMFSGPPRKPRRQSEQQRQIERVAGKIGPAVLSFIVSIGVGSQFHAQQLHDHVGRSVAPASADRILRLLRREGVIDYIVVDRRASLYRITAIQPGGNDGGRNEPD